MIVLDTSAVLAILWDEPEAGAFMKAVADAEALLMSTATRLELQIVCLRRKGEAEVENIRRFVAEFEVSMEPFDEPQLTLAQQAFAEYGASRHGLNFGDCFAYALAKARDLPLLFKGEDFAATDVRRAL
ncbi:type II toxin-antitoxin system VapC family toxin [Caulobacter zeae]|uniref:type II toxin-antitoxin system VapC family toxin n=1 Tax=Caulobacter zeae TaxID=2055137 RepID=UPI00196A65E0|nr:type II toxin-antitoxin system VapC family toxin [Caulobacter zeae]